MQPYVSDQYRDTGDAYLFCATLNIWTPRSILDVHCVRKSALNEQDLEIDPKFGIWIPSLKDEYRFFEVGRTCASAIGVVPLDGGDLLPYLKKIRSIVETNIDRNALLSGLLDRLDQIMSLPSGATYESGVDFGLVEVKGADYFEIIFKSLEKVFEYLALESLANWPKELKLGHVKKLLDAGVDTVQELKRVTEDDLMALKGIGKSKARSIRDCLEVLN